MISDIYRIPKSSPVEEEKRHPSGESRPAKIMKQSSFAGITSSRPFSESSLRQSEILQRQHEILSRGVDAFPFPSLPDNVIKPTFIKESPARRSKLKSSSQGSPASHASDEEKMAESEENNGSDKHDESSLDVSTPTTPLPRDFRARSESSTGL